MAPTRELHGSTPVPQVSSRCFDFPEHQGRETSRTSLSHSELTCAVDQEAADCVSIPPFLAMIRGTFASLLHPLSFAQVADASATTRRRLLGEILADVLFMRKRYGSLPAGGPMPPIPTLIPTTSSTAIISTSPGAPPQPTPTPFASISHSLCTHLRHLNTHRTRAPA